MECSLNIELFEKFNKNKFITFSTGIKDEKQSVSDNRG
jgi:hypothetical protein